VNDEQSRPEGGDFPADEMSVAESIGLTQRDADGNEVEVDETVEVGHGGLPVFWVVCIGLILLWAMVAWKPWKGY